jgi:hypothetical protein
MGCAQSTNASSTKKKSEGSKPGVHEDQVAGHVGSLRFDGNKLYKIGAPIEAKHYKLINSTDELNDDFHKALVLFAPITPKFYGSKDVEVNGKQRVELCIENLNCNDDIVSTTCSFMDIKIGTSTLTHNGISKGEAFIKDRAAKDAETTTTSLGFCICGFVIKDVNGVKTEQGYKTHKQVTTANVPDYLKKILVG